VVPTNPKIREIPRQSVAKMLLAQLRFLATDLRGLRGLVNASNQPKNTIRS
jgi:hypothetical protein